MKNKRIRFFAIMTVVLAISMICASGAALGVGVVEDAYVVGEVNVSPSGGGTGACIGENVTYSGSGMPADTGIVVVMGKGTTPEDSVFALLGTAMADSSGNWSLTAPVPATVEKISDGSSMATSPGTYDIVAASEDEVSIATGTLEVLDCATTLPSTGFPVAAAGLLGAGLLTSAGIGVRMLRRNR